MATFSESGTYVVMASLAFGGLLASVGSVREAGWFGFIVALVCAAIGMLPTTASYNSKGLFGESGGIPRWILLGLGQSSLILLMSSRAESPALFVAYRALSVVPFSGILLIELFRILGTRRYLRELESPDAKLRAGAAGRLWQGGKRAVPALTRALKDPDAAVRLRAAYSLAELKAGHEAAVPLLIELLSSPDQSVRRSAASYLGEFGPLAAQAVPALTRAMADTARGAREDVAGALSLIGVNVDAAVPALIEALRDADDRTAAAVARALGHAEAAKGEAVAALGAALADPRWRVRDSRVRESVCRALGRHGGSALPAAPLLADLAHKDWDTDDLRCCALAALGKLGPGAAEITVPVLTAALDSSWGNPRLRALEALAEIGPAASAAAPAIKKLLTSETHASAIALARKALAEIEPGSRGLWSAR